MNKKDETVDLKVKISPFFTQTRLHFCFCIDCRNMKKHELECNCKQITIGSNGVCEQFSKGDMK